MNPKQFSKTVLCSILLLIGSVSAQQTTGSLRGRISDFYGTGVRNATITIKLNSKKSRFERTTLSDDAGKYSFTGIPTGSYRITVTDWNGSTYENPSFEMPADQPARLDIKIEYGGDCSISGAPIVLSDMDKAEILNQILRDVLLKKQIPLYEQLKRQTDGIILARENIKAEWLKPPKKFKINLLGSAEIRQKAAGGEFLYLSFRAFRTKGNCVVAAVSNLWAASVTSQKTPVSGGGRVFVYSKKGNKLRLKTSGRWEF